MRTYTFAFLLLLIVPLSAFQQNCRNNLAAILSQYEQLKHINISFSYTNVDKKGKNNFRLVNKGEVLFTGFKSKVYFHIGGLDMNIFLSNKFVKDKHFSIKSDLESTSFYDMESSNVRIFEKMNNQLCFTRFKINQLIPPLFFNDSSVFFNRRFLLAVINEKLLTPNDSLLSVVECDSVSYMQFYRYKIYFRNFEKNKALIKWNKFFEKSFIENMANKQFIIDFDKITLLPVEYKIFENDTLIELYQDIVIRKKNESDIKFYNPYEFVISPKMIYNTYSVNNKIRNSCYVKYDNYASDFSETDYLSNKSLRLYDSQSEYILLYIWNSEAVDTTDEFKKI